MIHRMSEARLNDLVYLTLKQVFFLPVYGGNPRECDIRVCMDMTCKERIVTPLCGILRANEKAGVSHTVFYDVDVDVCFDECLNYIEDHWLKQSIDLALRYPGYRDEVKEWFLSGGVPAVLSVAEDQCGIVV